MSEHTSTNGGTAGASTASGTDMSNEGRRTVYEYVLEHGPVRPRRLREALFPGDRRATRYHLAMLKRDGYLAEADGRVRVAVDATRLAASEVDASGLQSPVEIRPATGSDRPELVDAVRSVSGGGTHVEAVRTTARAVGDKRLQRRDADIERTVYVASVDGDICGWAHVEAPGRSSVPRSATLTGGVVADRRGSGVGSRLLAFVERWAERRGYGNLYQRLPSTNRDGIDFLEARRWTVEATLEDRYSIGGSHADEAILSRSICE